MTVGELLHRMSSRELSEWIAYSQLEPLGPEAGWGLLATLASLLANIFRDEKAHPSPFRPVEFMPWVAAEAEPEPAEPPQQSWQEMLALVQVWNGGKLESGA